MNRAGAAGAALLDGLARHFPLALTIYFVVQIGRRLLEPGNLVLDEAEQILLTQHFAWGYGTQPPLYTWVQMAIFAVLGPSVLSIALLKNAVLLATFLFVFLAAQRVLGDRLKAVVATLSLFFIPQIAWDCLIGYIHTPMVVGAAAAAFLCFLELVNQRRLRDFVLFGVAVAVGCLSKYNFPVFVLGMLGAALFSAPGRRAVFDPRMFVLSFPITVLALLPTMFWSFGHLDLLFARTRKLQVDAELSVVASWVDGLADLALKTTNVVVVSCVIYAGVALTALFGGSGWRSLRSGEAAAGGETQRALRLIAVLTPVVCLVLVVIFVLATRATNIKERWILPYLFFFPLTLLVVFDGFDRTRLRMLAGIGALLAVLFPLAILGYNRLPDVLGSRAYVATPFDAIAEELRRLGFTRGTVLGSNYFINGNLVFQMMPDVRGATTEYFDLPKSTDPVLLVWRDEAAPSRDSGTGEVFKVLCGSALPEEFESTTVSAPYVGSHTQTYSLNVAIIPCGG